MPADCLVCGKPTTSMHMGMDACRACTVFYRRHRGMDRLQCLAECGDRPCIDKRVFACRKCRLDRFEAVMRAGEGVDFESSSQPPADDKFDSMMQQLIYSKPQASHSSIIERIRVNHRALSAFRREGELRRRGIFMNPVDAREGNYEIIPCTYQCMNEGTKLLVAGLFDFVPAVFPEFSVLSTNDKWLLIRNYQKIFHCVDAEWRALRRFGKKSFFTFGTYTTFLSGDFAEHFFSDCPDKKNLAAAAKTLRECIEENIPKVQNEIYQIDPSEDEFLAMIGLALWSVENLEPSEQLLAVASRYRKLIITELTAQYHRTIGEEQGTPRLGVILCLLQEFRRVDMNLKSEYEIYRVLDVFDDDTLMYRLQAHRSQEVS